MTSRRLPNAIGRAIGQPSTTRVGIVTQVTPAVLVNVAGTNIPVGVASGYTPQVGDNVAVTRQDGAWLATGRNTSLGTQVLMATCDANLGLVSALMDVSGTTLSFVTTATSTMYIATWAVHVQSLGTTATTGSIGLFVDTGTLASPRAIFGNGGINGAEGSVIGQYTSTVTAGTHFMRLRGQRISGADGMLQVRSLNTNLIVVVYG